MSGAGIASADHLLTLKFQEGTTQLATAALVPDTADIGGAVSDFRRAQAEEEADLPLSSLVRLLAVTRPPSDARILLAMVLLVLKRMLMSRPMILDGLWLITSCLGINLKRFLTQCKPHVLQVQDVQKRVAETLKIQAAVAERLA